MAKTKLAIQVQNGSVHPEDSYVMLGEALIKKWKIPTNQTLTLRYGAARKEIRVLPLSQSAVLRISDSLAGQLGLHHGVKLILDYRPGSKTLALGPLIGVLVSRVYSHLADRPFGATTAFCKEMTEACALYGGFVYFFTAEDISPGSSTVTGWSYAGRWVKRSFPVPSVVYNRLTSRKLENKPIVQHFMRDVKSRSGAAVFNEKYLDKTEVFAALRKESSLQAYLPESYSFKNFAMLKAMCKKHGIVFLKPITGSLGKGIIKIVRQPEGGYMCYFTSLNGGRKQSYPTLTSFFQAHSGKMKQRRYQIQQGLRLIEVGGRPVDFRALVQRSQTGEWTITSIVGRIAGNNTFVSNLARGGSLCTVLEAVTKSNITAGGKAGANAKLRKASLDIAQGIERQIPGHFGELGIDLALDTSGRVWLLEVNSKPSKDDNTPSGDSKIRPSVKRLILYSQYLASK